jgi:hypothetical protein
MTSRRTFLKTGGATVAGIGMASSFTGAMASCSANEKVTVGLVGCKGMGFADLKAFLENPQVECIALCDIDYRYFAQSRFSPSFHESSLDHKIL